MNILMIYNYLPPVEGGIEVHVHNLLKHFQFRNNVYFLTLSDTFDPKAYGNAKILKIKKSKFVILTLLRYIITGLRLAKDFRPHVIHAHTLGTPAIVAVFLGLILHCPIVITVHESGFIINVRSKKKRSILMYRLILRFSSKVITTSDELKTYVFSMGKNPEDIVEIPNGIDLNLFSPKVNYIDTRQNYGLKLNEKVVLCPRRIVPKNGIIHLIEACPLIIKERNDVRFLFVGPFSDRTYQKLVVEKVKKLGVQKYVIFTGGIPYKQMPKYYALSDIVVIPSLIEAVSLSALEAMACKKPIVATAVGGLREVIKNQYNGILVKPMDSEALAKAILLLLNDNELASKCAENAYLTAQRFSWEHVASKTLFVYKEAMMM